MKKPTTYRDFGIVFISPIIGLTPSLISAFDSLRALGVTIEGIDVFEGQNIKKSLLTILGLTFLPGSHKRRIEFANKYDEPHLFEIILNKITSLINCGKKNILLGGMSGGFVFAARLAQDPPDREIAQYASQIKPFVRGLFGISPFIFYPPEVLQIGADLDLIPSHIPTLLIWGDADILVPKGTVEYGKKVAQHKKHIKNIVIRGSDVGLKDGNIRHQFFGGRDFVKPLKNFFWNASAQEITIREIEKLIKSIQ